MQRLSSEQVQALDPYAFLAVLGKRVIHPGGRASTDQLLAWAGLGQGDRVLDIGCGVGTTAIRIARETGASDVAADISPLMRERATRNVRNAGVVVESADILNLPYAHGSFDCVLAEAVTMFVDRPRAAAELGQVCPGLQFDSVEEWVRIYSGAGLTDVRTESGPRKMAWLMPRMSRAVPYLGYTLVEATKPPVAADAPVL